MHIGISRPPTPPHPTPDVDGAVAARCAEDLGFESVFYGEHPIRPVDQAGQGVHAHGIPFFQDTLVMLARASAVTSRIRLGGGVFLIPQHNPVQFAKELASLDFYSGGRLIVGAGVGWSRTECEVLGGHFDRRWAQSVETIRIMKSLWSEETVSFDGEFYKVPPVQLFPQPASKPWPPVLIAGRPSERCLQRVVAAGDGWIPAYTTDEALRDGPAEVEEARRRIDRMCMSAGRDPSEIGITAILRGPQVDGDLGPPTVIGRDAVARFGSAGTDRVAISLPTLTSDKDAADALAQIAERVL